MGEEKEVDGKKHQYKILFWSVFQLSACTFGGGFVIIPLMRKKFVEQLHWIEEQEMLDLTAIAQSSPGAIAVNASILIGYHVAGITGALLAVLGTILPPLIIISIVSLFYRAFRDNVIVDMVMKGMIAGVAAVICDVVITMGQGIFKQKRLVLVVMMLVAFGLVHFAHMNVIIILLICGAVGVINMLCRSRMGKENDSNDLS